MPSVSRLGPFTNRPGTTHDVVVFSANRLKIGSATASIAAHEERHRLGGRAGHHGVDRKLLDGGAAVAGRQVAEMLVGEATRRGDVGAHPVLGRRDERQPVAPARVGGELLERRGVVLDLEAVAGEPLDGAALGAAVDPRRDPAVGHVTWTRRASVSRAGQWSRAMARTSSSGRDSSG